VAATAAVEIPSFWPTSRQYTLDVTLRIPRSSDAGARAPSGGSSSGGSSKGSGAAKAAGVGGGSSGGGDVGDASDRVSNKRPREAATDAAVKQEPNLVAPQSKRLKTLEPTLEGYLLRVKPTGDGLEACDVVVFALVRFPPLYSPVHCSEQSVPCIRTAAGCCTSDLPVAVTMWVTLIVYSWLQVGAWPADTVRGQLTRCVAS
jgi:hypothetical protein